MDGVGGGGGTLLGKHAFDADFWDAVVHFLDVFHSFTGIDVLQVVFFFFCDEDLLLLKTLLQLLQVLPLLRSSRKHLPLAHGFVDDVENLARKVPVYVDVGAHEDAYLLVHLLLDSLHLRPQYFDLALRKLLPAEGLLDGPGLLHQLVHLQLEALDPLLVAVGARLLVCS